jgi:hypothetical protein
VLSYSGLLLTTFSALRPPDGWPRYARELDAAASGDASALETAARQMLTPSAFAKATTSTAIQCLDAPASQPVSAWPRATRQLTRAGKLWTPFQACSPLTVASYGHPVELPSPCADTWRVRYLVNPSASSSTGAEPRRATAVSGISEADPRHDRRERR